MNVLRKYLIATAVITLLFIPFTYQAGAAGPKVSEIGNKHNLSSVGWNAGSLADNTNLYRAAGGLASTTNLAGKQICIFCHTPHSANVDGGAPLWNRRFSAETFSRYSSGTLRIRVDPTTSAAAKYDTASSWKPDGSTKLCLSCHDGVVTAEHGLGDVLVGGPIAMNGDTYISGIASFNPSNNKMKTGHHPVSFEYTQSVADSINSFKGSSVFVLPTLTGVKTYNNKMQCTTCHNAHQNQSNDTECYGGTCGVSFTQKIAPFWVYGGGANAIADQQSVCTTCHPLISPATGSTDYTRPW